MSMFKIVNYFFRKNMGSLDVGVSSNWRHCRAARQLHEENSWLKHFISYHSSRCRQVTHVSHREESDIVYRRSSTLWRHLSQQVDNRDIVIDTIVLDCLGVYRTAWHQGETLLEPLDMLASLNALLILSLYHSITPPSDDVDLCFPLNFYRANIEHSSITRRACIENVILAVEGNSEKKNNVFTYRRSEPPFLIGSRFVLVMGNL